MARGSSSIPACIRNTLGPRLLFPLPAGFDALDGIILTHAHLDHLGTLPRLQRHHPHAPVFLSEATAAIAEVMLHNSVNVMSSQREEIAFLITLFSRTPMWMSVASNGRCAGCGGPSEIGGGEVRAQFYDAGHVLGAVGVKLDTPRGTILHTGDVNFDEQSIQAVGIFRRRASIR